MAVVSRLRGREVVLAPCAAAVHTGAHARLAKKKKGGKTKGKTDKKGGAAVGAAGEAAAAARGGAAASALDGETQRAASAAAAAAAAQIAAQLEEQQEGKKDAGAETDGKATDGEAGAGNGEMPTSRKVLVAAIVCGGALTVGLGVTAYMQVKAMQEEQAAFLDSLPEEERAEVEKQLAMADPSEMLSRVVSNSWQQLVDSVLDPSKKHMLLPPPLVSPTGYTPKTLVLELEGLLVHTERNFTGVRCALRPGAKQFLAKMARAYEVVIFSRESQMEVEDIVHSIDPEGQFIYHRLFRSSCSKTKDGELYKDLSLLNRDLKNVVLVDTDMDMFREQPNNGIYIRPWNGDPSDRELQKYVPFLEYVVLNDVPDMRDEIGRMDGRYVPDAHAEFVESSIKSAQKKASNLGGMLGSARGSLFGGRKSS